MKSVMNTAHRQRALSGVALAALIGFQFAAPTAYAANECGALNPANGSVVCAPGAYAGGIAYGSNPQPPGNTNDVGVTLSNGVAVNTSGANGVSVTTNNGGTAQVDFQGNASVTTSGAPNGAGVNIVSGADVVVNGAAATGSVNTNAANSAGFSLSSVAAAIRSVTYNFLGSITTRGADSAGVSAQNVDEFGTVGSPNTIGSVTTHGDNSAGVDVSIRSGGPVASSVVIAAPEAIRTFGASSNAIDITAPAGTSTTVDITSTGGIETQGANSKGISVAIDSGSVAIHAGSVATQGAGATAIDINVLNSGSVAIDNLDTVTTSALDAKGVVAKTNQGNVSIDATGATIQTGAAGAEAITATGNASIDASGATVVTQADNSNGLSAKTGTGDAVVAGAGGRATAATVDITTNGANSTGALAEAGTGDADVNLNGTVKTKGDGANGVQATVTGAGTATAVFGAGTIDTQGADASGIVASNTGTGDAVATANGSTITTKGANAVGVKASAVDGNATASIDPTTITTWGDGAHAVQATVTGTGTATASSTGDVLTTNGQNANGILASNTGTGDANASANGSTITTKGEGSHAIQASVSGAGTATATSTNDTILTSGKGATGVNALNTGTGSATASATDSSITTAGEQAHGLQARTSAGDATAETSGGVVKTSGAAANGLDAESTGGNAAALAGGSVSTSGDGAAAVAARATGGNATAATKVGSNANVSTTGDGSHGLAAQSLSGGDASATVVAGTGVKTTGAGSHAVSVNSADGNATATTEAGSSVQTDGAGSAGLLVRAFKSAMATVGDLLTVNGSGSKGVDVASTGATAADGATATINASVQANGAGATAVSAATNGGTARVDVNADVFATGANGIAIEALSTTGVGVVDLKGNVTAGGTGVHLGAAGGNTLTNNAGFALNGGSVAAVHVDNGAATIVNDGTMGASGNRLVLADGAAGAIDVTNSGSMTGFMTMSGNDNTVTNALGATWTAKATSDFGTGNNTVTNAGVLRTDPAEAGTASVVFNGLTTLANKATGLITMINGKEGDRIATSGKYVADAGARLGLDAHLGGPGSRADTFAIGGSATGTTTIAVNDTNAGPGRYNPDGITLVTVGGANAIDSFRLASGPIDKGLWQYDLARFGTGTYKLVTAPAGEVMAAPSLLSQANRYWQVGQNAFDDHRASIRAKISGSAPSVAAPQQALGYTASAQNPFDDVFGSVNFDKANFSTTMGAGTAFWGQVVHASFTDRLNNATSAGSSSWSYDTHTKQDLTRFLGGIDFGAELHGDTALSFGLFGGYGTSDGSMNTAASGGLRSGLSSLGMKGTSIGGYAQYMAGPWWVGASTLYDSLDNNYRIDRVGFSSKQKGSIWGTQIDGGYTVNWSFGSIEPYIALTYLSARYDDIDSPWGRFAFGNHDGLDGKIGARTRIPVWASDAWNATLLGNLAITHGFKEGGLVTFDGFAIPNAKVANWGNIGGGVEVGSRDNSLTGYVKGDWLAASGMNGYSVLGGLNYRW